MSLLECNKYLLKYICKGYDLATLDLTGDAANQQKNEIGRSHDAQFAPEFEGHATLYIFSIFDRSPSVVWLGVHLESHHTSIFGHGLELQAAGLTGPAIWVTKWFETKLGSPGAIHFLYVYFLQYSTWTTKKLHGRQIHQSSLDKLEILPRVVLLSNLNTISHKQLACRLLVKIYSESTTRRKVHLWTFLLHVNTVQGYILC